jgi:hypothetical protein
VKTDKKQHPMGQMEPGKALVYVFDDETRDPDFTYIGGPTVKLGVDGSWMGANHYRSYFFFPVSAGEHRVCASVQSRVGKVARVSAATSLTTEEGKVYYLRVVLEMRMKRELAMKIEPLDSAEGALLIASSALSTSKTKK